MKLKISNQTAKALIEHIEMANNEGVWDEGVEKLETKLRKMIT